MDLGVVPVGEQEGKAEGQLLGVQACAEEDAQRRRVDERGVAKIDHDPLALFEEGVGLSRVLTGKLEEAQARIDRLVAAGDGGTELAPFEGEPGEK